MDKSEKINIILCTLVITFAIITAFVGAEVCVMYKDYKKTNDQISTDIKNKDFEKDSYHMIPELEEAIRNLD